MGNSLRNLLLLSLQDLFPLQLLQFYANYRIAPIILGQKNCQANKLNKLSLPRCPVKSKLQVFYIILIYRGFQFSTYYYSQNRGLLLVNKVHLLIETFKFSSNRKVYLYCIILLVISLQLRSYSLPYIQSILSSVSNLDSIVYLASYRGSIGGSYSYNVNFIILLWRVFAKANIIGLFKAYIASSLSSYTIRYYSQLLSTLLGRFYSL